MLRVAFDLTDSGSQGTGIAVMARSLAQALEETGQVELIRLSPPEGLRTPGRMLWDWVQFPWLAKAQGADLIHKPGFAPSPFTSLPQLVTIHDLAGLALPEETPRGLSGWYWRHFLPRSFAFADRWVTISQFSAQEIPRWLPGPRRPLRVIWNGLEGNFFHPLKPGDRDAILKPLDLPKSFLLAVATSLPRKDLPCLVEAFDLLAERLEREDLHLVLVGGPGPDEGRLQETISRAKHRARIRRLGFFPTRDLRALYAAAEVFVFPSRYEGFGLPPLEAMSQGTPVVSASAASMPEVLRDAARYFPPGDPQALSRCLLELLSSEDLRSQLQARGRRRAQDFTWEQSARAYLEEYRSLARPRGQAP